MRATAARLGPERRRAISMVTPFSVSEVLLEEAIDDIIDWLKTHLTSL